MFFRDRGDDAAAGYPMMPLRETVVFPHMNTSLIVGRPRSVAAVHECLQRDREIFLVTQKTGDRTDPGPDDIFQMGTIAHIERMLHLPDGNMKIVVSGRRRGRIKHYVTNEPFFEVHVEEFDLQKPSTEVLALMRTLKNTFERYHRLNRDMAPETLLRINAIEEPDKLADTLIHMLRLKVGERQQLLEAVDVGRRLERVYKSLLTEIEFLQVERKLKHRVKKEQESSQRESWLNEQMRQIQRELGDKDGRTELEELTRAIAAKDLPADVRGRAEKELRKLAQMNGMSAEATVLRNYLDCILDLPWTNLSTDRPGLDAAAAILDEDHYGLGKIKERILEYLAVETLVDRMRGPILCLVGPPGVGKTSLARSIARSSGRPFVRMSLGGVRDEAEIRGHRRTYIGAMPGKLIQVMKRAATIDPVILLDEIDKMSSDFRGDPAAALLEVLDPEQNHTFGDHYLDLDYNLSKVTFICTANSLQGIPLPLQDRLEIIRLSGYTDREKVQIARRYLLPKQLDLHGLTDDDLVMSDAALLDLVHLWTKEAGVRELERKVARVCRRVARRVVNHGRDQAAKITTRNLMKVVGTPEFEIRKAEAHAEVGLVKGLAVSVTGGSVLDIEVAAVPGKGKLTLTGRPGELMKESSAAVFTYVRSRAAALSLEPDFHETNDFHIHYPGLPLGVEGPSAGIAMATALVSAVTGIPVRHDTAMTGEISLRGRVLPIGGLKEKLLAAHRAGVTRVLIPEKNRKDLEEIPAYVLQALDILPVGHMDRVLMEALTPDGVAELFASYGTDDDHPVDSDKVKGPVERERHQS
jgi:ATP-dependent Lon protease